MLLVLLFWVQRNSSCQDLLAQQVCWRGRGSKPVMSYNRNSKTRCVFVYSRPCPEGPELNDASAAACGSPPCVAFSSQQEKQGLRIYLARWELTANVTFPVTLAAQLYQTTNLISQQLSKLSLPVVSSAVVRETNLGHVSWFQSSQNSHVLCSCCLNQIQRLN